MEKLLQNLIFNIMIPTNNPNSFNFRPFQLNGGDDTSPNKPEDTSQNNASVSNWHLLDILEERDKHKVELEKFKNGFVRQLNHEIISPLTNINLCLDLMRINPEKHNYYERAIKQNIQRIQKLTEAVNLLLDAERISQNSSPSTYKPNNLNRIITYTVPSLIEANSGKEIKVEIKLSPEPIFILGITKLLSIAITKLLENAFCYTNSGQIVIESSKNIEAGTATIVIQDSGEGIIEADLPHIFDEFYRGTPEHHQNKTGLGLGLTIARQIIGHHNGSLTIDSIPHKGTTATVVLPLIIPIIEEI